jgi:hypothetical protein
LIAAGEGKCDKCKLTDRLRDWSNEAKYRKLEYDAILDLTSSERASINEKLRTAKITEHASKDYDNTERYDDAYHRIAREKRLAGKAIEEGKTRFSIKRDRDPDREIIKFITKTDGEGTAGGNHKIHRGYYEYIINRYIRDGGEELVHEVFHEYKCKKAKVSRD